jgi:putative SOS response-associated peptidase YedK
MCSRFELNATVDALRRRFSVLMESVPNRAEVRPTDVGLVLGPQAAALQPWGLKASWDGHPLINARAETLAERASFKGLLSSRVLVPATAWWEWTGPGQKVRLAPTGEDEIFSFAGLTDGERFTIITCDAAPEMADMNDRMPVILSRDAEQAWLNPAFPFTQVAEQLKPASTPLRLTPEAHVSPQLSLF